MFPPSLVFLKNIHCWKRCLLKPTKIFHLTAFSIKASAATKRFDSTWHVEAFSGVWYFSPINFHRPVASFSQQVAAESRRLRHGCLVAPAAAAAAPGARPPKGLSCNSPSARARVQARPLSSLLRCEVCGPRSIGIVVVATCAYTFTKSTSAVTIGTDSQKQLFISTSHQNNRPHLVLSIATGTGFLRWRQRTQGSLATIQCRCAAHHQLRQPLQHPQLRVRRFEPVSTPQSVFFPFFTKCLCHLLSTSMIMIYCQFFPLFRCLVLFSCSRSLLSPDQSIISQFFFTFIISFRFSLFHLN